MLVLLRIPQRAGSVKREDEEEEAWDSLERRKADVFQSYAGIFRSYARIPNFYRVRLEVGIPEMIGSPPILILLANPEKWDKQASKTVIFCGLVGNLTVFWLVLVASSPRN